MDACLALSRAGYDMITGNRHVFARTLTGKGVYSYWGEVLSGLKRVYILQGAGPGGRSLFLRLAGIALTDRGYQVEYYHRAEDHLALEGLVVPVLRAGILDVSCAGLAAEDFPPHLQVVEVNWDTSNSRIEDLVQYATMSGSSGEVSNNCEGNSPNEGIPQGGPDKAARFLKEAEAVWKRICMADKARFDEESVRSQAAVWVRELLARPSCFKRFFAGTVTPEGPVSFIPHLTAICEKRYFIKGTPGSGRPVIQEILIQGLCRYYAVEAYYSYLDQKNPVMLIYPELGVAVVDGTCGCAPVSLPEDTVWDVTAAAIQETEGDREQAVAKSEAELFALLAAAGCALGREEQGVCHENAPVLDEDMVLFVSRFLKEN